MSRLFDDASTQYLTRASAVVTAAPLSMFGWVQIDADDDVDLLTITETGANTNAFRILRTIAGPGNVTASTRSSSGFPSISKAGLTSLNTWYHVGGTFESSTNRKAWLNGSSGPTNTFSSTPTGLDTTTLGAYNGSSIINPHSGLICEVGIWNVALTTAEVGVLAAGYSPLFVRPASLVAYWPIIGKYSPEIDIIGGAGLTLTNGPTAAAHPRIYMPRPMQLGALPAAAPPAAGRVMASLAGYGGLVGHGGIAGQGGGLAG